MNIQTPHTTLELLDLRRALRDLPTEVFEGLSQVEELAEEHLEILIDNGEYILPDDVCCLTHDDCDEKLEDFIHENPQDTLEIMLRSKYIRNKSDIKRILDDL